MALALSLVARLVGVKHPLQRGLGVDDDVLAAGQPDDEVGRSDTSSPATDDCSTKSQCLTIPDSSTTLRSCIWPHWPRALGLRSAVTSAPVSLRRRSPDSVSVLSCSSSRPRDSRRS